jgi:hypothetical protein
LSTRHTARRPADRKQIRQGLTIGVDHTRRVINHKTSLRVE